MIELLRITTLVIAFSLLSACSLVKYTIEHAPYTVLESDGDIEIRHYDQMLFVTTSMVVTETEEGDDGAFRKLFKYISGNNETNQDISMTAPVFMDEKRENSMSFVLPKDFSLESTPLPLDEAVKLEQISDYTVAVIRFNGWLDQDTVQEEKSVLLAWLDEKQIAVAGESLIAGYDPPSSIPWFRRNEVLIPIDWSN